METDTRKLDRIRKNQPNWRSADSRILEAHVNQDS